MTRKSLRRMAMRMLVLLVALSACHPPARPAGKDDNTQPRASLSNATYRPFLINNIFNHYANNGDGSYNPFWTANEGFEFPKGLGKCLLYEDGVVWGGYHKGRAIPKVSGSSYHHALQPGTLIANGTASTDPVAANPADPKYRVYSVRPDVRPDIAFSAVETLLNAEWGPLTSRHEPVTAQVLYDRYIADWNEWPAADGAPFKDVNGNGSYEQAVDIPGQPGADQTLWYVANDMDAALTQAFAGCPPIGIEMHRTIWGYRRSGALGNTIFISTVLINKSGAPVDSMYIVQWADPDIGDAGDDFVGCDTTRDLGYAYNGWITDGQYGRATPALGFALLQGPMAPGAPADTALLLSSRRAGFANLRMTAFLDLGLSPFIFDPAVGLNGDVQWYRLMKGLTASAGIPYLDPLTGKVTPFCVAGDPVRATDGTAGWVDGISGLTPGDRRLGMSTGPFTFAHGDTQEVIVACYASLGMDRIASIASLRSDFRSVQSAYTSFSTGRSMPAAACSVQPDSTHAAVSFRIDARGASVTSGSIVLTTFADEPVIAFVLADDGMSNDGVFGDGIWGGTTYVPIQRTGMKVNIHLTYADGKSIEWSNAVDHITTAPLTVTSSAVASDNINSDGIPNPGENIRFVITLRNDSPITLSKLSSAGPDITEGRYEIGTIASGALLARPYNADDPTSWFVFDVPAGYPDSTFIVAIVTTDDSANVWRDTLTFPVRALPGKPYTTPVAHAAGKASGAYSIQIVDPAKVKDHLYVIRGDDSAGIDGTFTLRDSTTGAILLDRHPVPDMLGHTIPVVDGFKVLKGTIDLTPGMRSWAVPQGARRFSPVWGFTGCGLEGFSDAGNPTAYDTWYGTIGAAVHFTYGQIGTTISAPESHTVLLKLAAVDNNALWDPKAVPADANFSRGYRFLRGVGVTSTPAKPEFAPWIINKAAGFPYQDYNYSVPFSAWDMDTDPPARLAVGHFENNATSGLVDGRYWPGTSTVDNSAAREFAFIFRSPYTDTPDPSLMVNLADSATTPLMWVMTCSRRAEEPWPGSDQFMIEAYHFPTSQDAWVFNPSAVLGVKETAQPSSFALLQNFPNPFNPSTTIRYELPAQGMVTVTVFDVLGRAVRHLVKEVQPAGSHAVLWRGDTDTGIGVASGVYFYRCTIERSDRRGQFDQTMKMVLLK